MKLLDFGLAKFRRRGELAKPSDVPTLPRRTAAGACSARSATCRPSRCAASRWTTARTSSAFGTIALWDLSGDLKWVLARRKGVKSDVLLWPTGAGESKVVSASGLELEGGGFFPDGKRLLLEGRQPGRPAEAVRHGSSRWKAATSHARRHRFCRRAGRPLSRRPIRPGEEPQRRAPHFRGGWRRVPDNSRTRGVSFRTVERGRTLALYVWEEKHSPVIIKVFRRDLAAAGSRSGRSPLPIRPACSIWGPTSPRTGRPMSIRSFAPSRTCSLSTA